jgi:hypothetical protein
VSTSISSLRQLFALGQIREDALRRSFVVHLQQAACTGIGKQQLVERIDRHHRFVHPVEDRQYAFLFGGFAAATQLACRTGMFGIGSALGFGCKGGANLLECRIPGRAGINRRQAIEPGRSRAARLTEFTKTIQKLLGFALLAVQASQQQFEQPARHDQRRYQYHAMRNQSRLGAAEPACKPGDGACRRQRQRGCRQDGVGVEPVVVAA